MNLASTAVRLFRRETRKCIYICLAILALISLFFLSSNRPDLDFAKEHQLFWQITRQHSFVPKIFQVSSKTNFWANQILVDEDDKKLFCMTAGSTPYSFPMAMIRAFVGTRIVGKGRKPAEAGFSGEVVKLP